MSLYGSGIAGAPTTRKPKTCAYPDCEEEWAHLRCAKCKNVYYCCKEHQALHWKEHRLECLDICNKDHKWIRPRTSTFGAVETGMLRSGVAETEDEIAKESKAHAHVKSGIHEKYRQRRTDIRRLNDRIELIKAKIQGNSESRKLSIAYERDDRISTSVELDLDRFGMNELKGLLDEQIRLRDMVEENCKEIEKDSVAALKWETFESGHETRDVLENGERREHMEARYGRKVELQDIEREKHLPITQRRQLMLESVANHPSVLPGPINSLKSAGWAKLQN